MTAEGYDDIPTGFTQDQLQDMITALDSLWEYNEENSMTINAYGGKILVGVSIDGGEGVAFQAVQDLIQEFPDVLREGGFEVVDTS